MITTFSMEWKAYTSPFPFCIPPNHPIIDLILIGGCDGLNSYRSWFVLSRTTQQKGPEAVHRYYHSSDVQLIDSLTRPLLPNVLTGIFCHGFRLDDNDLAVAYIPIV